MASYTELNRITCRPLPKATPIPLSTSKKLVEPFNRLKYRANLFRRKNYSSQLNISSPSPNYRSSTGPDHIVSSHQSSRENSNNNIGVILLKRSNSMVCPQKHLHSLLNQNNNNNNNSNNNNNNDYINQRNSICIELAGCSTDESSTDDYQVIKSSSSSANHYWTKPISSKMNDIDRDQHEIVSSTQPLPIIDECKVNHDDEIESEDKVSSLLPNENNNSEQASVILPSTMNVIRREKDDEEKQQEPISSSTIPTATISSSHSSSSSSSSSSVILRDHAEAIRIRRQCHSSISLLQHQQRQQSLSSPSEEPFYDCKQQQSPQKPNKTFDMSIMKISTCTMTGKSLNNLDDCLSTTSSEEKGVQTTLNESLHSNSCIKRAMSSTSLSSSSASIQTDSLEKKPKTPILTPSPPSTTDETTSTNGIEIPTPLPYKWPHVHERLLGEQACIYWVNYLGSTAIKMSPDGTTAMPSQAIARLKQSTQYARVLPIIGLSISSRGVEFLKHTKDRLVICFHDIKSIHCACQDPDLRYFAYVTREHRLTNGMPHTNSQSAIASTVDNKQQLPPSPSLSIGGDYHHYCHVFVVKSEAMSTEIMLTFGQVFDIAYRLHRRLKCNGKKSKDTHLPLSSVTNNERHHPQLEVIRLSTKSDTAYNHNHTVMSSSTHSPAISSSSSSSADDRKIFV